MASWYVYIDDVLAASDSAPDCWIGVTNTGVDIQIDIEQPSWTYQGPGTFLGLSRTKGATQPDSDLGIGGSYYEEGTGKTFRFYSVADLTGTTWKFNSENLNLWSTLYFAVDFESNGANYSAFRTRQSGPEGYYLRYDNRTVYDGDVSYWYNEAYRTISITGGSDARNPDFISWLNANAVQQGGVAGSLVVAYNGSDIHTSSATESFGLKTAGTFLTDDITLTAQGLSGLTVTYGGVTIVNASGSSTRKLKTAGKFLVGDIGVSVQM